MPAGLFASAGKGLWESVKGAGKAAWHSAGLYKDSAKSSIVGAAVFAGKNPARAGQIGQFAAGSIGGGIAYGTSADDASGYQVFERTVAGALTGGLLGSMGTRAFANYPRASRMLSKGAGITKQRATHRAAGLEFGVDASVLPSQYAPTSLAKKAGRTADILGVPKFLRSGAGASIAAGAAYGAFEEDRTVFGGAALGGLGYFGGRNLAKRFSAAKSATGFKNRVRAAGPVGTLAIGGAMYGGFTAENAVVGALGGMAIGGGVGAVGAMGMAAPMATAVGLGSTAHLGVSASQAVSTAYNHGPGFNQVDADGDLALSLHYNRRG